MTRLTLIAAACLALSSLSARADDAAKCDEGIAMIKAEQAKNPAPKTAEALKTALRVAEREKGEKEYDECLDAIADASKALKK